MRSPLLAVGSPFLAALFLIPLAAPALALVFDSPIAYEENFEGEASFPTSPQFDAFGAGGFVAKPEAGTLPTFTGSAVHADVGDSDFEDGVILDIDHELISTLASEVGARTESSGLGMVGSGGARVILAFRFSLDHDVTPGGTFVAAAVEVTRIGGSALIGRLLIVEEHFGPGAPDLRVVNEIPLGAAALAEIFAGAPFAVELEVDRDAATARASVQIGSQPELVVPALALSLAHDYSITEVEESLRLTAANGHTVDVDFAHLQVFAEPHTFEPLLNLDLGTFWGVPDPSFGAAGGAGVWNQIAIGGTALVDLAGNPTAMSALLTAESLGEVDINGTDLRNMISDWAVDSGGWALMIDGLADQGAYRVTYYVTAAGAPESGLLSTNGLLSTSLPGVGGIPFPVLLEGVTYKKVEAIADGGELDLFADSVGSDTHLSGVQVDRTVVVPEVGVGVGLWIGGIGLLGISRRSRVGGGGVSPAGRGRLS